jgi:hypothetical protein
MYYRYTNHPEEKERGELKERVEKNPGFGPGYRATAPVLPDYTSSLNVQP